MASVGGSCTSLVANATTTVVMSFSDYVNEAERHLNDTNHYLPLESDPTPKFTKEINDMLHQMEENTSIAESTMRYLLSSNTRPARFYLLPKIHKPGNPGRPIISSIDTPTEKISKFVDYHLRPLVKDIPSYIKDTTHFLHKVQSLDTLPPDSLLVTLDVCSLYTNIPHDEGILACSEALATRDVQDPPTEAIVTLISYILKKNNFVFGKKHYLQIHGTAMGTCMAPSYANLFMAKLEQSLLSRPTTVKPSVWWRYIDDIFVIWNHGSEALKLFIDDLNTAHPTIKFTANWSHKHISFLDTMILNRNGSLSTDLYTKSTDTHQYLSATSCHPSHCKSSIPYSQALRIRRICSSNTDFKRHTDQLHSHLIHRGYDPSFTRKQINRAYSTNRRDALTPKPRNESSTRVPLVTTFHPNLPNLPSIITKYTPLLHVSPHLKLVFPEYPIVAYRRPRNLRDMLVSADLKPQYLLPAYGSTPCGSKRCLTCQHIQTGTTIQSTSTGCTFKLHVTANCKTSNIIYVIQCKVCNSQYVGETKNPLHIRLNGHRNDIIKNRVDKPVASHFNGPGHTPSDFTIMVLEQMKSQNPNLRKYRESYWIFQLDCLHPNGMNLDP